MGDMADWATENGLMIDPDYGEAPNLRLLDEQYQRQRRGGRKRPNSNKERDMKDVIRAMKAEQKRLAKALKQVNGLLTRAGASEGKAKRPRKRATRKALGTPTLATPAAARSVAAAKPSVASAKAAVAASRPAGTPVQPKPNGPSGRRPTQSVDDLLKD